jgi:hypothetical protein
MRRRGPIKVREIAEPRRTLEVAALLSVTAIRQSDMVLRLIEMRIAEVWSWAQAVARPEPHHHLPEEVACVLARVMDDSEVSDAEYRERSRVLLAPWRPGARQARRTRAAQVREHLAANARRVRPLLKHIITLNLQSIGPHPVIEALGSLRSVTATIAPTCSTSQPRRRGMPGTGCSVHPIVSWRFVPWKRPRCGAYAAGCATAHCGSRMPNSMAVSTGCYCRRCVGLQLGEPSSTGTICRPRQTPSLNACLARLAAAARA